jgi:hypothetical protein
VREFPASEEDVDEDFVLVFEEFPSPLDLDLDVVVSGLGPNPDFLDLDLMLLLFRSFFLLRVRPLGPLPSPCRSASRPATRPRY